MDGSAHYPPLDELLQALQVELGSIAVHAAALSTVDDARTHPWTAALDAAHARRDTLLRVLGELRADPDATTPERAIALRHSDALVKAIETVRQDGNVDALRIVAAECVTLAETMARPCRERVERWLEQRETARRRIARPRRMRLRTLRLAGGAAPA